MQAIQTKRATGPVAKLTVVTSALVKKDKALAPFYQPRHDVQPPEGFVQSIKTQGILYRPLVLKFADKLIVVDGSKRVMGAKQAGLKEIDYDLLSLNMKSEGAWTQLRDIQVGANEQRVENTIHDRLHNIMQYLQLDPKTGKPKGLSFEETGKRFNLSHQQVRNLALLAMYAPEWLKDAIQRKEIPATEAHKLVAANLKESGDEKTLKVKFEKWQAEAHVSKTGAASAGQRGGDRRSKSRVKKVARNLLKAWRNGAKTPAGFKLLLQVILGEISIAEAREIGKGFEDWMFEDVPKKAKAPKQKKGKGDDEDTVTAEDVEEEELFEEDDVEEEEDFEDEEDDEEDDEEYDEDEDDEEEFEDDEEEEE